MAYSLAVCDGSRIIYHFIGATEDECYAKLAKDMDVWNDDPADTSHASPQDARGFLEGTDFTFSMVSC